MEHSCQIVRKDLPIFFSFFFSDGRNTIGLHIVVAAACSVGVFWAAKASSSLYFCGYHL